MKKLRVLLLANNVVGLEVAKFLKKKDERIVALGIHEKEKQKFTKEIVHIVMPKHLIHAKQFKTKNTINLIKKLKPDIIVAAFWGYILKPELLAIPRLGAVNFHPGYLPYNRGLNPNVWPFIEGTPAGVTLHFIDNGVDTGDIIIQKKIPILQTDTAGTIEEKTWKEIVNLFKKTWPLLRRGKIKGIKQDAKLSTTHKAIDVNQLDEIKLDKNYRGRELISRLRARSYKHHTFAYFVEHGRKIYVKIKLSEKPRF